MSNHRRASRDWNAAILGIASKHGQDLLNQIENRHYDRIIDLQITAIMSSTPIIRQNTRDKGVFGEGFCSLGMNILRKSTQFNVNIRVYLIFAQPFNGEN